MNTNLSLSSSTAELFSHHSKSTIIWCVEGEHIPAVSKTLFGKDVTGICVEAFLNHMDQTLQLIKHHKAAAHAAALPAFLLSLAPKEQFAISAVKQPTKLTASTQVIIERSSTADTPTSPSTDTLIMHFAEQPPAAEHWQSLKPADHVYIGFDAVVIKINTITHTTITGEVINNGMIHPQMHLHLPLKSEYMTQVMSHFIENSLQQIITAGVHYLLLPGCLPLKMLKTLRHHLPEDNVTSPWLVWRLDSEQARQNLTTVMPYINGVMIARRELALTAQPDLIPVYTKDIIDQCRNYAKLTIVASQMLGSMKHNITPTRAEVSDMANAVFDGADAIMLSEAVLKGKYAQDAHRLAQKIIDDITDESSSHKSQVWAISEPDGEMDIICTQAAMTAIRVGAKALVCITKTGNTAIRLSTLDTQLPIVAITFDEMCAQKLKLLRGVHGMRLPTQPSIDEVLPRVNELLKQTKWLKKSDKVVFVTVTLSSMSKTASNLFTVQNIY